MATAGGVQVCPHCDTEAYGIDVDGVYDGILFWVCPACNYAWPRFNDGPLGALSATWAARWPPDDGPYVYDATGRPQ